MANHPKGLYLLFFTEMWERFSYYGMRAIFTLYMVNALLFDRSVAARIYGSYTGLVYLTPLLGGYVADRYWGNRRSIIFGGLLMAAGQFTMFLSGTFFREQVSVAALDMNLGHLLMFAGLGLMIFGNGFFKPNISTMVGQLYPPGDRRVDAAFTIFYMGINLGAFLGPLVCGGFGERYADTAAGRTALPEYFRWGFLAAGIGMILSVVSFVAYKNRLLVSPDGTQIGAEPNRARDARVAGTSSGGFAGAQVLLWSIVFLLVASAVYYLLAPSFAAVDFNALFTAVILGGSIAVPGLVISDRSLQPEERQRIWVIYIAAVFMVFFWSAFEQAGVALTYFAAEQTDRVIRLGTWTYEIPASYFQSINAIAIVIFAPLFSLMWTGLGNRGLEPSSIVKQALGLILLALGYVFLAFGVKDLDPAVKVSMFWLVAVYVIHTWGELCLSPIGLSMVAKLSPARFGSLLMGVWFMANSLANNLAGFLSSFYPPSQPEFVQARRYGIDLPAILNKTVQPTAEQLAKLHEIGVRSSYPVLAGIEIHDLYQFFMIFVFSAGAAGIILLLLSRWLLRMMHGIR